VQLRTGILAGMVAAAALSAWGSTAVGLAADGEPIACGSVVTEDATLTQDLVGCADGLVIGAANVTLDLGGHQISGVGSGKGVSVQAAGVVVRNGSINRFARGVYLESGVFDGATSSAVLSGLVLASNGQGVGSFFVPGGSPSYVRIEDSTIRDNEDGTWLMSVGNSEIVDSRILDNGRWGIFKLYTSGRIEGNLVAGNGADGIHLDSSHSVVLDNTLSRNGGDGLFVYDEAACAGHLNLFRVGANLANGNEGLGINIYRFLCPGPEPVDLLDAGGNAASRNGDPRECTVVECARNRGQANKLAPTSSSTPHVPITDPTQKGAPTQAEN
jgi:parallel beta-helix repeat protein